MQRVNEYVHRKGRRKKSAEIDWLKKIASATNEKRNTKDTSYSREKQRTTIRFVRLQT